MFEKAYKTIALFANVCIILLTIMGGLFLVRYYRNTITPPLNTNSIAQNQASTNRVVPTPGKKVSGLDVDWAKNGRTMLFVLSTSCGFCAASSDFYKQAVSESQTIKNIHFVAVFPEDTQQGIQYLKEKGIGIQDVKKATPGAVGTSGFPTLMLVDNTGTIKGAWLGKLSKEKELEVLSQIKCTNCI